MTTERRQSDTLAAVERGQQAIESGELAQMIQAYHDLKGFEL